MPARILSPAPANGLSIAPARGFLNTDLTGPVEWAGRPGGPRKRQPGLTLYLLAAALPSNHSLISDESAVVLAAARVGRAGEPRKLVNTTDLPTFKR